MSCPCCGLLSANNMNAPIASLVPFPLHIVPPTIAQLLCLLFSLVGYLIFDIHSCLIHLCFEVPLSSFFNLFLPSVVTHGLRISYPIWKL